MSNFDAPSTIQSPRTVSLTDPAEYPDGIIVGIESVLALFNWRKQHANHHPEDLAEEVRAFIEDAVSVLRQDSTLNGRDRRSAAVGALDTLAIILTAGLESEEIKSHVEGLRHSNQTTIQRWKITDHDATTAVQA